MTTQVNLGPSAGRGNRLEPVPASLPGPLAPDRFSKLTAQSRIVWAVKGQNYVRMPQARVRLGEKSERRVAAGGQRASFIMTSQSLLPGIEPPLQLPESLQPPAQLPPPSPFRI